MLYVHGKQLRSYRDVQLSYQHCSWASRYQFILSAHHFAINWQILFLNQRKRKNGRRNIFMTKSSRKDVLDARIDRGAF